MNEKTVEQLMSVPQAPSRICPIISAAKSSTVRSWFPGS